MTNFRRLPVKLQDCKEHGPQSGAELFIVEGDSASSNVSKARDPQFQAVLPMQGKPMNALKASESRLRANSLFSVLIDAMGTSIGNDFATEQLRYQRILLLFDPDADGIHCGALMLMFFSRFMPELLVQKRVLMVRAPLFRISSDRLSKPAYASSEGHYQHIVAQLRERNVRDFQTLRYRGLGSLEESLLVERCIDPATRTADSMGPQDAEMAIDIFAASAQTKA